MTTYQFIGGCHCENIQFEMDLTREANTYTPRVCDCDFCLKHGASYLSDAQGKLVITIKHESDVNKYQQGNKLADFLICKNCGVLVGVTSEIHGKLYATINSKAITNNAEFGLEKSASPKKLDAQTKTERWEELWFPNTVIKIMSK